MKDKKQNSSEATPLKKAESRSNWNIRPYLAISLSAFLVFCMCVVVFFTIYRFSVVKDFFGKIINVLQPVIIGFVIAYLINPIMKMIERMIERMIKKRLTNEKKRRKISRAVGTAGALIVFLLIIVLLIELVVPQLISSISGMVVNLPDQVDSLIRWIDKMLKKDSQAAELLEEGIRHVSDFLNNWFQTSVLPDLRTYVAGVTTGVISVVKVLLNFVVGLVIAAYLLFSQDKFIGQGKKLIYALLPVHAANILVHTARKSNEIFGGFISGKILDSAIIGVLCYIVLSIMKMPYTLLVSLIVGITNIIPFFGPFIGAIPSTVIIALANPIQGVYFVIFVVILQQLDGNVIGPKILGDSTGLSPFWVVFAILLGGGLFGFAGMVLGVPTFAVIYYIAENIVKYILRRRKLPEDTDTYIVAEGVDRKTHQVLYKQNVAEEEEKENTV